MSAGFHTVSAPAETVAEIRSAIDAAKSIGCLAHKDADADSLGSALAFALALRASGRAVRTMVPSPKPILLEYLPGFDTIVDDSEGMDLLFAFDCASVARFGDLQHLISDTRTVVNVDHHVSNEGFGTVNLIDPQASATGQVVHALLKALQLPLTADIATNLYAALFTDTGGFRHESTTEAALLLGSELVAEGADAGWVARQSYQSRSIGQLRLEGMAIATLQSEADGQLIWSAVTEAMLAETRTDMQMAEGVIDQLQSIGSMKIAVLFKEVNSTLTKISVRTRDQYDATDVCIPFGGGGHRRASGAEVVGSLAEVQDRVLAVARGLVAKK